MREERRSAPWPSGTKAANAKDVVMIDVLMRWSFIIGTRLKKTLIFPAKGIREAGLKSEKNWTSALFFAQIVIASFTQKLAAFSGNAKVISGLSQGIPGLFSGQP